MAQRLFKGRTNNHLTWVMVDATDFATPESALSAATKIKVYGKLRAQTGVYFVSSGAGSLTNDIQHVGASALGIYTIALAKADLSDASAAWYDQYVISLSATGAAYQTIIAEGVIDDSALSGVVSDIYSALVALSDATSNAYSAAVVGTSRITLVQSRLSDFDSRIVSDLSDVLSAVNVGNSRVLLVQSLASDAHSAAAQANSRALVIQSLASDAHSAAILGASHASDAYSAALLIQSRLSDLDSRLASDVSDIYSALTRHDQNMVMRRNTVAGGAAATVTLDAGAAATNSLYNDLILAIVAGTGAGQARAVQNYVGATKIATVSPNWETTPVAGDSFVLHTLRTEHSHIEAISAYLVTMSGVLSDVRSQLTAGVPLDASTISDLRSAVAATELDASDLSDIASAVWANAIGARVDSRVLLTQSLASDAHSAAAQTNSRALVAQSYLSDIRSHLSAGVPLDASTMSDIRSAVNAVTVNLTASDISDIASAVAAAVTTVSPSDISDIASAVWAHATATQVNSRVLLTQSFASDAHSAAAQTNSRVLVLQSRLSDLDSRLVSDLSDVYSATTQINSRVLVGQSYLSDLRSHLTAGVPLDASTLSDLRSAITAGGGATISASDISDIASAVWANTIGARVDSRVLVTQSLASDAHSAAAQASSRALLVQSTVSDIYSLLSDVSSDVGVVSGVQSDIYSLLQAGVEIGASSLSDLRSMVTATELDASDLSDIASAVWARAGADPTGVVSPTGTMGAKVDWMTALARNQITQTSGVQTIYNDALSAVASAAVADDGSVFTRGEFA